MAQAELLVSVMHAEEGAKGARMMTMVLVRSAGR